jgi:hypothetical protein
MHDRKGNPIKIGDLISLECRIKDAWAGSDPNFCSIMVETLIPMGCGQAGSSPMTITLAANQVEKFADGVADASPEVARPVATPEEEHGTFVVEIPPAPIGCPDCGSTEGHTKGCARYGMV